MSFLRGDDRSAWSLPDSVDALAASARQTSRPALIWGAGLAYQFVVLGWTFASAVAGPLMEGLTTGIEAPAIRIRPLQGMEGLIRWIRREGLEAAIVAVPLALLLFRLAGGLARLAPAARWAEHRGHRPPGLGRAWREGRGSTLSGIGLWLLFVAMMLAATVVFMGPTRLLLGTVREDTWNAATAIVSGVTVALLLVYGFLLSILFQLALHSLVQNRRGAASALLHAWRIARNDAMATARATAVDAVLYLTLMAVILGAVTIQKMLLLPEAVLWLPYVAVVGFGGCARCVFWARAYEALGGISTLGEEGR